MINTDFSAFIGTLVTSDEQSMAFLFPDRFGVVALVDSEQVRGAGVDGVVYLDHEIAMAARADLGSEVFDDMARFIMAVIDEAVIEVLNGDLSGIDNRCHLMVAGTSEQQFMAAVESVDWSSATPVME